MIGNTLQASMDFKVVYMARLHKFCSYMHKLAYFSSLLKFCLWAVPVLLSIIGEVALNVLLGQNTNFWLSSLLENQPENDHILYQS